MNYSLALAKFYYELFFSIGQILLWIILEHLVKIYYDFSFALVVKKIFFSTWHNSIMSKRETTLQAATNERHGNRP